MTVIIIYYIYIGCTYYDIHLYGGSTSGMVQLCNANGGWEAVCDYDWDCYEPVVACHQLGYPGGIYCMHNCTCIIIFNK